MAADFKETNRALSRVLTEQARTIGVFNHPTAKGDGREELLRDFLRQRIGTSFGVSKAEVVDSLGQTTPEFDALIYDQSTASVLNVVGQRCIVRVENVAVITEVKSNLDASTGEKEAARVRDGIGALRRFFEPTPLLKMIRNGSDPQAPMWKAADAMFKDGLSPLETFEETPAVVNAYFAFDGPGQDAALRFLGRPMLDVVCVLGKYTIAKPEPGGSTKRATDAPLSVWAEGDDALGAFLQVIDDCLRRWREGLAYVHPAGRYYKPGG